MILYKHVLRLFTSNLPRIALIGTCWKEKKRTAQTNLASNGKGKTKAYRLAQLVYYNGSCIKPAADKLVAS